jgi:hypothetical protein
MKSQEVMGLIIQTAFHIYCAFLFYYVLKSGKIEFLGVQSSRSERPTLFFFFFILLIALYMLTSQPWEFLLSLPWEWKSFFS